MKIWSFLSFSQIFVRRKFLFPCSVSYNFAGFPGMKALFCPEFPINLEIPVVFSKKYVLKPHLFLGKPKLQTRNQSLIKFLLVHWAGPPFFTCFLSWPFHTNVFPVSIPKIYGAMHELYISWLVSYSCHDSKCQMCSYLALCQCQYGFKCLKARATFRRQFSFYH